MFISDFHRSRAHASGHVIQVSADQGHRFAKDLAGDFNPLHDADSSHFIVPGDLLFSLFLSYYGISRNMRVEFQGMVAANAELAFPALDDTQGTCELRDLMGKTTYLKVTRSGEIERNEAKAEALIRAYVAYSGESFPHVLVPLMCRHGWMINTQRPLVLYQNMSLEMQGFDFERLELRQVKTDFKVQGKRGRVSLAFELLDAGRVVGRGSKTLVAGGLRPYEETSMQGLVTDYAGWRRKYLTSKSA